MMRSVLFAFAVSFSALAATAAELVMVERTGCHWCESWHEEVGDAYPKTSEGQFAPLRAVQINAIPADIKPLRRVTYTPTFLLVEDGVELARLEGYAGEDFFWPLLDQMLSAHTAYDPTTPAIKQDLNH